MNDLAEHIEIEGDIEGGLQVAEEGVVHHYDGQIVGDSFEDDAGQQKEGKETKVPLIRRIEEDCKAGQEGDNQRGCSNIKQIIRRREMF